MVGCGPYPTPPKSEWLSENIYFVLRNIFFFENLKRHRKSSPFDTSRSLMALFVSEISPFRFFVTCTNTQELRILVVGCNPRICLQICKWHRKLDKISNIVELALSRRWSPCKSWLSFWGPYKGCHVSCIWAFLWPKIGGKRAKEVLKKFKSYNWISNGPSIWGGFEVKVYYKGVFFCNSQPNTFMYKSVGLIQGVFLTGTPPESSKYKKVNLG